MSGNMRNERLEQIFADHKIMLDLTPAAGDGQDALFPQPTLHLKYHHVNIIFRNPYSAMAFAGAG